MRMNNSENQNEELRIFLKKSAQQNSHQKNIFKKLLKSGIQIDYRDPSIMRMISMGIPSQYRSAIWPALMEDVHGVTLHFYHTLINKAATLINASEVDVIPERVKIIKHLNSIEHDINRTFPELKIFTKQSQQGQALFNILSAFTVYRQDLGYLQGMSQIAAFLLLQLKQLESFTVFCSLITTDVIFSFYSMDLQQIQKIEIMFESRLKRGDEDLYRKIKKEGIELRQFLLPWIMTLFTRLMNVDMTSQIWDIILLHGAGIGILLEISFNILVFSKKIIGNSEHLDDQQFFQAIKSVKFSNSQAFQVINSIRNSHY